MSDHTHHAVEDPQSEDHKLEASASMATGSPASAKKSVDSLIAGDKAGEKKLQFNYLAFLTFLMIGTVQLIGWNSLLNATTSTLTLRFPDLNNFLTTVTATYSTVIVVATILLLKYASLSVWTTYIGLALSAAVALAYALSAQFGSISSISLLFHLIGAVMAICSATIGSSAFGYAAIFPTDYSGVMSAGLGLSGVVSFGVWMIAAYGIFPNTPEGVVGAVWVLSAVIIIVSVVAIVMMVYLFSQSWVKRALRDATSTDAETQTEVGTYEQGGLMLVLKKVAWLATAYFFHMMITLTCFPAIGPASWSLSPAWKFDLCVGVFQVGDLIGRYLPNVVPILRVRAKTAVWLIASRLIFLLTFILSFKLAGASIVGAFWFHILQMLLLSLTNGWLCTVCFLRIPELVEGAAAKGRTGAISLLATFIGIACGQWIGFGISKL